MDPSPSPKYLHRQSIILAVVCLLILGLIYLLTVAGDLRTQKQLSRQLTEVTRMKEQREILLPLVAELQKNEPASPAMQDALEVSAMAEAPAKEYETTLRHMLRQFNLTEVAITPDVYSVLANDGLIRVDLTARGAFSDFRRLILQLGALSYLSGIDKFRIQKQTDGAGLEMFLQLTIQLEQAEIAYEETQ